MSEVISFRINTDNLREAKAHLILKEWKIKGYSTRQTITEALLKLDQNDLESKFDELNEALSLVKNLLRQIETGNSLPVTNHRNNKANEGLSANFISSVKKSAKSGINY